MDQPLIEFIVYAREDGVPGPGARESEALVIAAKLRRTSSEVAEATRMIIEDTQLALRASGVSVMDDLPLGIDLLEDDYRVGLYTGAPEFAEDGAPSLEWQGVADLEASDAPRLIAALVNNATGEVSTLHVSSVELHEGSLVLSGKMIVKGFTAALVAAVLSSYGGPIAATHYTSYLEHQETMMVQEELREDPLVADGACALKLGYVLDYDLLLHHARIAYDYEDAETPEQGRQRICNLQVALHALDYSITSIDGVMGPNTRKAWDRFRTRADGTDQSVHAAYQRLLHEVVENKSQRVREIRWERQRQAR